MQTRSWSLYEENNFLYITNPKKQYTEIVYDIVHKTSYWVWCFHVPADVKKWIWKCINEKYQPLKH
jgi:hypothetical protein